MLVIVLAHCGFAKPQTGYGLGRLQVAQTSSIPSFGQPTFSFNLFLIVFERRISSETPHCYKRITNSLYPQTIGLFRAVCHVWYSHHLSTSPKAFREEFFQNTSR